jgi:biotin transport system substrate-specific component
MIPINARLQALPNHLFGAQQIPSVVKNLGRALTFSLILAALSRLSFPLPFSPVPVSGLTFGMIVIGIFCRPGVAVSSLAAFFILGFAGLPLFALGKGFFALGPTLGYLVGTAMGAVVLSLSVRKIDSLPTHSRNEKLILFLLALMAAETIVFLFGAGYLKIAFQVPNVWAVGILPFVIGELFKCSIGVLLFLRRADKLSASPPGFVA